MLDNLIRDATSVA